MTTLLGINMVRQSYESKKKEEVRAVRAHIVCERSEMRGEM
jgi:hypothetical protein